MTRRHAIDERVDDPDKALCDGPNMLSLEDLPDVLKQVRAIGQLD
jgi:3-deoxy-D-manno-octulosonic acid (KDO) 8-phosphate synthase